MNNNYRDNEVNGGHAQSGSVPRAVADARETALKIVYDVTEKGAYANLSLDKALRNSQLSQNDKNLVTEIVNGSIRMEKHLDWVLNLFLQKPLSKQNPNLRNILRISAYQLLFMDRIPDYAIVNSAVEMSRKKVGRGLASVCNGVLRNMIRERENYRYPPADSAEYLAVCYSQPEWLVDKWLGEYGRQQTEAMFAYLNKPGKLSLRVNKLKAEREQVMAALSREGVIAATSPIIPDSIRVASLDKNIEALNIYQQGNFYIQNEASMLAGSILDPLAGEIVIDLCCGLGGKSTHFAERMQNRGRIYAVDLYQHKLTLLEKNCQRLGITMIETICQDILQIEDHSLRADRVFLDAPCSGLGVLNRRADSRWKKKPQEIIELIDLQRRLLEKAGEMVKPGGILVYSTCTINKEENEGIVQGFLSKHPEYQFDTMQDGIDLFPLDQQDQESARQGLLTLLPGKYGTDGMFYARMRRRLS